MSKIFSDTKRQKVLEKIQEYLVEDDFPIEHLRALRVIVQNFNECRELEEMIFDFAHNLAIDYYEKARMQNDPEIETGSFKFRKEEDSDERDD